jgi:hypothetical protein
VPAGWRFISHADCYNRPSRQAFLWGRTAFRDTAEAGRGKRRKLSAHDKRTAAALLDHKRPVSHRYCTRGGVARVALRVTHRPDAAGTAYTPPTIALSPADEQSLNGARVDPRSAAQRERLERSRVLFWFYVCDLTLHVYSSSVHSAVVLRGVQYIVQYGAVFMLGAAAVCAVPSDYLRCLSYGARFHSCRIVHQHLLVPAEAERCCDVRSLECGSVGGACGATRRGVYPVLPVLCVPCTAKVPCGI